MPRFFESSDIARAMVLHCRASEGDVVPPKRSSPCVCPPSPEDTLPTYFYRDPHPGGWCRSCGRLLRASTGVRDA